MAKNKRKLGTALKSTGNPDIQKKLQPLGSKVYILITKCECFDFRALSRLTGIVLPHLD